MLTLFRFLILMIAALLAASPARADSPTPADSTDTTPVIPSRPVAAAPT